LSNAHFFCFSMPDRHKWRMDLKRVRTFVAVAEHGTVSKASEVLNITQPALSRQIGSLERELDFKLFGRVGRRPVLTTRGEQLLADCRSLLAHAGAVDERARGLGRGDMRVLRVAGSALTIEGVFPTFLGVYAERNPGVRLALVEADAARHLDLLERGEVHLAINVVNVIQVDDHRFASYLLPPFHVLAACSRSLDIEQAETIDIRRLAHYPLLLPHASFATRAIFDAACRVAGVRPNVFIESGAAHALLALAEAGHGVAIIPSILKAQRKSLQIMRVVHRREPLRIALAVLWDRRRTQARQAEGFGELLAAHIKDTFTTARHPASAARVGRANLAGRRRTSS
jgi:DNA-binding transcriptional LysR family regulator